MNSKTHKTENIIIESLFCCFLHARIMKSHFEHELNYKTNKFERERAFFLSKADYHNEREREDNL
jgi:hypothetical protein